MYRTHYSHQILMKLESSGQIFEKSSNIRFHENSSSGSRVVPCKNTRNSDLRDHDNPHGTVESDYQHRFSVNV